MYVLEFPEYVTAWQDVHGPNLELTLALVGDGDADEQLSGGFFKLTVAPTGENACACYVTVLLLRFRVTVKTEKGLCVVHAG